MSSDVAISIKNLTKTYRIYDHPLSRIRQKLTIGARKHYHEFIALDNVSFEIRKGETIGIVGRNGSGKSTLLQIICGIRKPTAGMVQVNGRISALLELGAGFHPEFTGRENVYMQGAIMGMPREEMERRFSEIEAFADIGEFIEQPVKTYSSGMFLRLAFAVAVNVEPDILIVDEALAVGDARFQSKCFRRLEMLKNRGTTILVVTHATEQITRQCDSALLLEKGRLVTMGDAGMVVNKYLNLLFDGSVADAGSDTALSNMNRSVEFTLDDVDECFHLRPAYNQNEYRWGDRSAVILDFQLESAGQGHIVHIDCGENNLVLRLKVLFLRDVSYPVFGLTVKTKDGSTLCGINSRGQDDASCPRKFGELVRVDFSITPHLNPGDYFISVGVVDNNGGEVIPLDRRYDSIHLTVAGQTSQFGMLDMSPKLSIAEMRFSSVTDQQKFAFHHHG